MDTRDTLLAHLVPTLTSQTENAATKSLAYILNKSEPTKRALNEMIRAGVGVTMDPVEQVRVEVAAEDQSRPDFVGYDVNGTKRVVGESKFWAPLGKGQGSVYLKQLASGPSVLMFVVPEARLISLWDDVVSDVEEGATGVSLQPLEAPDSMMAARSLAGKPLAGFYATRSRRIQVLYGMVVHVIRCNTHHFIDNRR